MRTLSLTRRSQRRPRLAGQHGLSLVELMVGLTIGLIVTTAASLVMVQQVVAHRRLALEIQLQQDLRAALDPMQSDLRRAGFWATAERSVWAEGESTAANPYQATPGCSAVSIDGKQVVYAYSTADYVNTASPRATAEPGEDYFGLRFNDKTLYFMRGCSGGRPNWQPLTDTATVIVDAFTIRAVTDTLPLAAYCSQGCQTGDCPRLEQRRFDIQVQAHSPFDPAVKRSLSISTRPRNEAMLGACPA